jgi:hypothetical protein
MGKKAAVCGVRGKAVITGKAAYPLQAVLRLLRVKVPICGFSGNAAVCVSRGTECAVHDVRRKVGRALGLINQPRL